MKGKQKKESRLLVKESGFEIELDQLSSIFLCESVLVQPTALDSL